MYWYILLGVIILLIVLIIYVYFKTKDTLKEAFQVIDNMDLSNMDINKMAQAAQNLKLSDLSGVIDLSGNINAEQMAIQLQQSFNVDLSTVDSRPITNTGKQCDTYAKQLADNQILLQKFIDIGDWNNVRATKKMIQGLQESMVKLNC